jgi:hypothetical protein
VGIIGIHGNNIFSSQNLPFKMVASIKFFNDLSRAVVQPWWVKLRSKITGDQTFNCKLFGGMPGKCNEFKNSVG